MISIAFFAVVGGVVQGDVDQPKLIRKLVEKATNTIGNLISAGVFAGDRFTDYGIALAAFRVDVLRGVTVGATPWEAAPVDDSVLAYPQARSGLVEWAEALGGRNRAALLLADYQGSGPSYRVRAVLLDGVGISYDILKSCFS
ncbi:hypothetical protein ODS41_12770 [Pyrobaculum sp. 3827-6]|uniref:hypothetical protein n=1 Tax=Pyrobaculum sp. 3827-6 TaxID=2983604 RepID=UPI0021D965C6|nr:hypothetical protein [Pyrobaculum sp. 3827-6]MCU7788787.1 hypothetical protein [Pyrobaculum sp. 3827-6]